MLKVGFYEKEITPPLGADMPGGFSHHYAKKVAERLYAKAAALNLGDKTVIIISLDMLKTIPETYENIHKRITEYTGIPEECIMVGATHTHTGPSLHVESNEHGTYDAAYCNVMERLAADAAILAYQRMVPATVRFNHSREEGLTFNRNYVMKDGNVRTNPGYDNPDVVRPFGPADEDFATLFFYNEAGEPIGAMANFACHNCSTQTPGVLSSDYAGVLSNGLKKELGDDFVTLFLTGACGNLNHINLNLDPAIRRDPRHRVIGARLAEAAIRHMKDNVEVKVDTLDSRKDYVPMGKQYFSEEEVEEYRELKRTIPLEGLRVDISKTESREYKRGRAERVIYIAELPEKVPLCVQTVRLGDIMIYALPNEIYTEYGLELKEKSPSKITLVSTLSNGSYCYVPVPEARGKTIYEASKTSAFFEDNAGSILVEKALEQAKDIMK